MTLGRSSCESFSLQKGNNHIFHEILTNVLLKQLPSKKIPSYLHNNYTYYFIWMLLGKKTSTSLFHYFFLTTMEFLTQKIESLNLVYSHMNTAERISAVLQLEGNLEIIWFLTTVNRRSETHSFSQLHFSSENRGLSSHIKPRGNPVPLTHTICSASAIATLTF